MELTFVMSVNKEISKQIMKHSEQKMHDFKAASWSFVFCRVDSQLSSKQRLEEREGTVLKT